MLHSNCMLPRGQSMVKQKLCHFSMPTAVGPVETVALQCVWAYHLAPLSSIQHSANYGWDDMEHCGYCHSRLSTGFFSQSPCPLASDACWIHNYGDSSRGLMHMALVLLSWSWPHLRLGVPHGRCRAWACRNMTFLKHSTHQLKKNLVFRLTKKLKLK